MRRREFITLLAGAVAWPLPARAQQSRMPVIGFLRTGEPPKSWVEAFQQSLRERGYVAECGRQIPIHRLQRRPASAACRGTAAIKGRCHPGFCYASGCSGQEATTSVPIVLVGFLCSSSAAHAGFWVARS
jgi:putative tryptophan/tyrosine transport system substrate-binding protein